MLFKTITYVFYIIMMYYTLEYAKKSATQELDKHDRFCYFIGIAALIIGGM